MSDNRHLAKLYVDTERSWWRDLTDPGQFVNDSLDQAFAVGVAAERKRVNEMGRRSMWLFFTDDLVCAHTTDKPLMDVIEKYSGSSLQGDGSEDQAAGVTKKQPQEERDDGELRT